MRHRQAGRNHLILIAMLAVCAYIPVAAHADPEEVVVYTTSQIQLSNVPAHAQVIELDGLLHLEEQISEHLPADPQAAASIVQQRMSSPKWRAIENQLRSAAQGVAQAQAAQIRKVPAVTVDNAYVVYGATDVASALQQIKLARDQR